MRDAGPDCPRCKINQAALASKLAALAWVFRPQEDAEAFRGRGLRAEGRRNLRSRRPQFGWHIIKVEERRTHPLPTFDQVKDAIISQLSAQKADQKLKELHDAAKIEIIDPDIKKSMDAAAAKNLVPSDQPEQGSESGKPPG
jgi:hypothetical protein